MSSVSPIPLSQTNRAKALGVDEYSSEGNKIKNGEMQRLFEWYDYTDENGDIRRFRRDFKKDDFFYDESFILLSEEEIQELDLYEYSYQAVHTGKRIELKMEAEDGLVAVLHGPSKVYDATSGTTLATLEYEFGRPIRIFINHYFTNGQLQFVREITSLGQGNPFENTGVREAYYPDGSPFENPITDDGSAIILLNDEGQKEDECPCMGQDIMEWGRSYLYAFIGKHVFLLESIYGSEGLECCWE